MSLDKFLHHLQNDSSKEAMELFNFIAGNNLEDLYLDLAAGANTILRLSVSNGHLELVKILLSYNGAPRFPLVYAAAKDLSLIKLAYSKQQWEIAEYLTTIVDKPCQDEVAEVHDFINYGLRSLKVVAATLQPKSCKVLFPEVNLQNFTKHLVIRSWLEKAQVEVLEYFLSLQEDGAPLFPELSAAILQQIDSQLLRRVVALGNLALCQYLVARFALNVQALVHNDFSAIREAWRAGHVAMLDYLSKDLEILPVLLRDLPFLSPEEITLPMISYLQGNWDKFNAGHLLQASISLHRYPMLKYFLTNHHVKLQCLAELSFNEKSYGGFSKHLSIVNELLQQLAGTELFGLIVANMAAQDNALLLAAIKADDLITVRYLLSKNYAYKWRFLTIVDEIALSPCKWLKELINHDFLAEVVSLVQGIELVIDANDLLQWQELLQLLDNKLAQLNFPYYVANSRLIASVEKLIKAVYGQVTDVPHYPFLNYMLRVKQVTQFFIPPAAEMPQILPPEILTIMYGYMNSQPVSPVPEVIDDEVPLLKRGTRI